MKIILFNIINIFLFTKKYRDFFSKINKIIGILILVY